ncbi:hypothetical protein [Nocardia gipuzkoensis]|uniref:hypothetical protein n=1 Tax=Nocardia gipuzkoensis TaxID=2749991 RepID=UPI00237E9D5B|nr:hypothetical protein [Nocardia gipuzkoensis]MDE1674774.1 hypothetical protein [Nocardia gipuzkoensis]
MGVSVGGDFITAHTINYGLIESLRQLIPRIRRIAGILATVAVTIVSVSGSMYYPSQGVTPALVKVVSARLIGAAAALPWNPKTDEPGGIDVTLKNIGGRPAVARRVIVTLWNGVVCMAQVPTGDTERVPTSAVYSVRFPATLPSSTLSREIRYEIWGASADRMSIELNLPKAPAPYEVTAAVALQFEDSLEPLQIGVVTLRG